MDPCPYCEGAREDGGHGSVFRRLFSRYRFGFPRFRRGRLGTIHVLKDFTSRREAENKFRTLFEKVQEGVFIATPEGRFLDFNDAFMRILGYENHEELLRVDIPRNSTWTRPTASARRGCSMNTER